MCDGLRLARASSCERKHATAAAHRKINDEGHYSLFRPEADDPRPGGVQQHREPSVALRVSFEVLGVNHFPRPDRGSRRRRRQLA